MDEAQTQSHTKEIRRGGAPEQEVARQGTDAEAGHRSSGSSLAHGRLLGPPRSVRTGTGKLAPPRLEQRIRDLPGLIPVQHVSPRKVSLRRRFRHYATPLTHRRPVASAKLRSVSGRPTALPNKRSMAMALPRHQRCETPDASIGIGIEVIA